MLSPEVIAQAEKRIGQTIGGKWHLDRVIGVGGMAAVYEATHRNRNRVAIKLLHPILSIDEGTRHRFLREGYVANTIRHEGAVQVLDDEVSEEGIAFLVMELLEGETVEDRMDRKGGVLDIPEALDITEQLLDVLCSAHDQGVVHRDIKPDNLFLTEHGKLKVLDFGIARLHQGDISSTRVGSFMGTPAYCAPEQARGRWDEVDARTDLFSVAATLFTAITGTHLHPAETSSEQLALAIGASARSLAEAMPEAPSELVQFVDKALAYDKEDRFQSARVMKAAIQRVRAGIKDLDLPPPVRRGKDKVRSALGFEASTVGGDEESFAPLSFYPIKPPVRVLIGLLAAGVLGTFLLIAAQNNHFWNHEKQATVIESSQTSKTQRSPDEWAKAVPERSPAESITADARSVGSQAGSVQAQQAQASQTVHELSSSDHAHTQVGGPTQLTKTTQTSELSGERQLAPQQAAPAPPSATFPHAAGSRTTGTAKTDSTASDDAIFGSRF